jgi:hypothetical protein
MARKDEAIDAASRRGFMRAGTFPYAELPMTNATLRPWLLALGVAAGDGRCRDRGCRCGLGRRSGNGRLRYTGIEGG